MGNKILNGGGGWKSLLFWAFISGIVAWVTSLMCERYAPVTLVNYLKGETNGNN